MPAIDITEKVKNKLKKFKDSEGCKTFSEAVNILLTMYLRNNTKKNEKNK